MQEELIKFFIGTEAWMVPAFIAELVILGYSIKLRGKIFSDIKNKRKIKIKKDFKTQDISKVMIPPEVKIDINNLFINGTNNQNINKKIMYFFIIMHKHFKTEDLTLLYNNIKDLIVKKNSVLEKIKFNLKNCAGIYYNETNSIKVNKIKNDTFFHELLHMATAYMIDNILYCGFFQGIIDNENEENSIYIGDGINEGYTELMTSRYFGLDIETSGYYYFAQMAQKLEEIVGKEKMEKLYLHADLKGLIDELSKYATVEDTMDFIKNVDFILYHEDDHDKDDELINMLMDCRKNIVMYLSKTYQEKLKIEFYKSKKMIQYETLRKFIDFSLPLFIKSPLSNKDKNKYNVNMNDFKKLHNSLCKSIGIKPKYNISDDDDLEYIDLDKDNFSYKRGINK